MHIRILLVEDNPDDARLLREALIQKWDTTIELTHVNFLDDGIALASQATYDILLLDLGLPDYQGLKTLRQAKEQLSELPIIVLTDAMDEDLGIEAVQNGAQDYLVKNHADGPLLMRSIRYAIERAHVINALKESEERYALAVEGARDGLWDWDLKKETVYLSPRWKAMIGYSTPEISDSPDEWTGRVHPDDLDNLLAVIENHKKLTTPFFEHEYRICAKDGSYRWMLCRGAALYDTNGCAYRIAGSQTDITERHLTEERLTHDALHDALTGLPNRMYFLRMLDRAIERSKTDKNYIFAVLFIDLDRYKIINDSLGHILGDQLLIAFAQQLEKTMRPGDSVARLGGDEFAIFLNDVVHIADTVHIAERIQHGISQPFILEGHEIHISASIGIALSSTGYERPELLLRDADIAMYQAKAKGKARYEIFDKEMHENAVARLALEMDLRRAVEQDALEVYYQPIVSLESGCIIGFEALARWQKDNRFISPKLFIHAAEECGLISAIGEQVMDKACHQLKSWQEQKIGDDKLIMSVNLSSKQFMNPALVSNIKQILDNHSLDGKSLRLEITESAIVENSSSVTEALKALKALGIQLSMDDFGTGYASLSSLHRLPIDTLKVDRTFISGGMSMRADGVEMIRTIISMAHNLSMDVVAEGVETEHLLRQLKQLDCEYAQGYYFSPAVDYLTAADMLASNRHWSPQAH